MFLFFMNLHVQRSADSSEQLNYPIQLLKYAMINNPAAGAAFGPGLLLSPYSYCPDDALSLYSQNKIGTPRSVSSKYIAITNLLERTTYSCAALAAIPTLRPGRCAHIGYLAEQQKTAFAVM
jgi:hypothetical protein